jgi:hypothetical protein
MPVTGPIRTRTTALLTVEEVDQSLAKSVNYSAGPLGTWQRHWLH